MTPTNGNIKSCLPRETASLFARRLVAVAVSQFIIGGAKKLWAKHVFPTGPGEWMPCSPVGRAKALIPEDGSEGSVLGFAALIDDR
mmetsp:Transcript_26048/g.44414  ORF Transcript_26048/g.44414 Transcript_26048/m.44414 type:complete len:86 (-) Transcript_26048:54-311(-)|eukprot:CAMPEP_0183748196 /NCGR_PEP_ID=MMETSP0737-20130205/67648_1 /TAXON_ID=385413 /ORGANISM="Thalassiosira miniscula, Strain CCMP1093" /LENGTH=85 /DNA_ID=CAMNT_0025983915 /DNA_START=1764 /DNA_END=2024 /DNA_ORIENTATION=-